MKRLLSWILTLVLMTSCLPAAAAAETLTAPELLSEILHLLTRSGHSRLSAEDADGQLLWAADVFGSSENTDIRDSALYLPTAEGLAGVRLEELFSALPGASGIVSLPLLRMEDLELLLSLAEDIWQGVTSSGIVCKRSQQADRETLSLLVDLDTLRKNLLETVAQVLKERGDEIDPLLEAYQSELRRVFPYVPQTSAALLTLWNTIGPMIPKADFTVELLLGWDRNGWDLSGTIEKWKLAVQGSRDRFILTLTPGSTLPAGTPVYHLDSHDLGPLAVWLLDAWQYVDSSSLSFESSGSGSARSVRFRLDTTALANQLSLGLQQSGLKYAQTLTPLIAKYQPWIDLLDLPYEINAQTLSTLLQEALLTLVRYPYQVSGSLNWQGSLFKPWHASIEINNFLLHLQGDASSLSARAENAHGYNRYYRGVGSAILQFDAHWGGDAFGVRFSSIANGDLQNQLSLQAQWGYGGIFVTAESSTPYERTGFTLTGELKDDVFEIDLLSSDHSTQMKMAVKRNRIDLTGTVGGRSIDGFLILSSGVLSFRLAYGGNVLAEGSLTAKGNMLTLQMTLGRLPFYLSINGIGGQVCSLQFTAGAYSLTGELELTSANAFTLCLNGLDYSLEIIHSPELKRLYFYPDYQTWQRFSRHSFLAEYRPGEQLELMYTTPRGQTAALGLQPDRLQLQWLDGILTVEDISLETPGCVNAITISASGSSYINYWDFPPRLTDRITLITRRTADGVGFLFEVYEGLHARQALSMRILLTPAAGSLLVPARWETGAWLLERDPENHSVLSGSARGQRGYVFAHVTLNEDDTVADLHLSVHGEGLGFGSRCQEDEAFIDQFIGQRAPFIIDENIDALAGATITSKAVATAINNAYPRVTQTGEATGKYSLITATVVLKVDGTIESMTLDTSGEHKDHGLNVQSSRSFTRQFVGETGPFTLGEDGLDAVSGATVTSQAAVEAVNNALRSASDP